MKAILSPTTKMVDLNGITHRVWEGETSSGIKCHAFITRIAIDADEPRAHEFSLELLEKQPPSVEIAAIPQALII